MPLRDHRFPHTARVSRRADLERVRREGKALRTNSLLVRVSPSPQAHLRVGLVVPRYGYSAVERNQLKRRLRELARMHLLAIACNRDVVIWAQRSAYARSFNELQHEVEGLIGRIARVSIP